MKTATAKRIRALKRRAAAWRDALRFEETMATWRLLRARPARACASGPVRRVVLLPADPHSLTGSKGDEAMMRAAIHQLRQSAQGVVIAAVTASSKADAAAAELGLVPLPVWSRGMLRLLRAIGAFEPDLLLVVGADVMDGFYNAAESAKRLAAADLAVRSGIRASVLGFSFNSQPSDKLGPMLRGLSPELRLNVRDPLSRERFSAVSGRRSRLVADVAFMLEPALDAPCVAQARGWVATQRAAGATVLGFNVHPHLVNEDSEAVAALTESAIRALRTLLEQYPVSVMLVPHDYRGAAGDGVCLVRIWEALREAFPGRLSYPQQALNAGELKALAGLLDGVITGRMHLAIAALGMGVPVAALTYQDKFQGLFLHFDLSSDLLLPQGRALASDELFSMCAAFLSNLPVLRAQVASHLPDVMAAARRNLSEFLREGPPGGATEVPSSLAGALRVDRAL